MKGLNSIAPDDPMVKWERAKSEVHTGLKGIEGQSDTVSSFHDVIR
jgi:hypothetical protein